AGPAPHPRPLVRRRPGLLLPGPRRGGRRRGRRGGRGPHPPWTAPAGAGRLAAGGREPRREPRRLPRAGLLSDGVPRRAGRRSARHAVPLGEHHQLRLLGLAAVAHRPRHRRGGDARRPDRGRRPAGAARLVHRFVPVGVPGAGLRRRRHPPRPVPQRARRTVAPARLRPPGRRGPPPPGPFAAAGPDAAAVRGHGAGRGDTGGRSVKALELDGVHAGYGPARVLRGVDLTVPDGATVALLGANGAGKTTLLRAAAGLLPVSAGTVRLAGRPAPAGADARARAGLCLIPEGRGVFPRLTVEENVALFAGGRRRREEAFDRVTAVFPVLGQRRHQVAGTLSGGQQQMLAFSRALCTDAALVLADELSFG